MVGCGFDELKVEPLWERARHTVIAAGALPALRNSQPRRRQEA